MHRKVHIPCPSAVEVERIRAEGFTGLTFPSTWLPFGRVHSTTTSVQPSSMADLSKTKFGLGKCRRIGGEVWPRFLTHTAMEPVTKTPPKSRKTPQCCRHFPHVLRKVGQTKLALAPPLSAPNCAIHVSTESRSTI